MSCTVSSANLRTLTAKGFGIITRKSGRIEVLYFLNGQTKVFPFWDISKIGMKYFVKSGKLLNFKGHSESNT
jgi:hypothetical protein